MPTLLVAIAGAAGAVLRYRIGVAVGVRTFPWATLGINLVGCFLLAALLAGPVQSRWGATATTAIGIGLLGSFTTFSTFGYETLTLLRTGRVQCRRCLCSRLAPRRARCDRRRLPDRQGAGRAPRGCAGAATG